MKITSLSLFKFNGEMVDPTKLGSAQDLSNFGYFERGTVREMLVFVSRTIVKRTQPGQRQSVQHNGAPPNMLATNLDELARPAR